ncbi:unnamed protein product [Lymnaea stagnalis]|uniref:Ubiquitin-like domain-containing protein n=1 Tax=Lymnaea stagnalis TaxID=6523 RepID=A0AAV2IBG1_LYMST
MADNVTSMDFDGDSDSGIVAGSSSESVCSDTTLIGSPTASVHGDEAMPSPDLPTGGTTQQASEVCTTSSGFYSGEVGSTSSVLHSGGVGSASSGFHSGGINKTLPQQTSGVAAHQHGSQSGDSGIFSLQTGTGHEGSNNEHPGSEHGQAAALLPDNQDSTKATQEWLEKHFDVFVKTLEGKTVTVQASADENVTSFRAKVDQRTGVPAAQLRLTSQAGRTLEDGKSLRDYQIGKHSTIYCQGRLRGGVL